MRRFELLASLLLSLVLMVPGAAWAQSGDWVLLGKLRVQPGLQQDSFSLPDATPGVTQLRLQVRGGRVVLARVQVGWADGSIHVEDRTINLLDNERTRPMATGGIVRKPQRIGVLFDLREPKARAVTLEAWGFKPTDPDAVAAPEQHADAGRQIAGQDIASGPGGGIIRLEPAVGRLARIRLHLGRRTATIETVRVVYDRGAPHVLSIGAMVPAGTSTPWLPVDPGRDIRSLELSLAPAPDGRGQPRVTVLGEPARGPAADRVAAEQAAAARRAAEADRRAGESAARREAEATRMSAEAAARGEEGRRKAPAERSAAGPPAGARGVAPSVPVSPPGVAVPARTAPVEAAARSESPVASAPSANAPAAAPAATPACIAEATCTPVPVYIGTSRVLDTAGGKVVFTTGRSDQLALGRATVTVPRAYRKKGEITLPGWNNLFRLSLPWTVDPTRHFTILEGATRVFAVEEDFLADVLKSVAEDGAYKDHAFVFVHGFNVSFDNALYRTAQIAFDLGTVDKPFGTAFLFAWPSKGEVGGYLADKESARLAVPQLKSFVELVATRSGVKNVHLIAHSMGNAVLLNALVDLAQRPDMKGRLGQVILASPDVDAKEFEGIAARILPVARAITLYASSTDLAMVASRNAYDAPRAGDLVNGRPVFIKDLDSIDVSGISSSMFSLNHSLYADKKELLNDMRSLMLNGTRPPHVRNINLQLFTDRTGSYWKYVE